MKRTKNIRLSNLSDFYCTRCGHKGIPIIRKPGKAKEPGHLKKLYCNYCHESQNMVEIKSKGIYKYEDFYIEFNYHNFLNGKRKESNWKIFVNKILDNMNEREYDIFLHNIENHK